MPCPLCKYENTNLLYREPDRDYYHCGACDLIFVPNRFHLSKHDEKQVYNLHQNCPDDEGYRMFLNTLAKPLIKILTPGMSGLDFGSGPGPTLNKMMCEYGYPTTTFDIYYDNQPGRLERQYDFVTCSETVEHFCHPAASWHTLFRLVKPHGYLGIMTLCHDEKTDFVSWWYKNDRTHIMFYSKATFDYLKAQYNASIVYLNNRIVIFKLG